MPEYFPQQSYKSWKTLNIYNVKLPNNKNMCEVFFIDYETHLNHIQELIPEFLKYENKQTPFLS